MRKTMCIIAAAAGIACANPVAKKESFSGTLVPISTSTFATDGTINQSSATFNLLRGRNRGIEIPPPKPTDKMLSVKRWNGIPPYPILPMKEVSIHANGRITYKGFRTDGEALRMVMEVLAEKYGQKIK